MKKLISLLLVLCVMCCSFTVISFASADEAWLTTFEARKETSGKMLVTHGENEHALNFTWFSDSKSEYFSFGSDFPTMTMAKVCTCLTASGYKHTVKLTDLNAGEYDYIYTSDSTEYADNTITVADTTGEYTIMYCTDPQLGRSGEKNSETSVANDEYGFEQTVSDAVSKDAGLIICGGDMINEGFSQTQMNVLLSTDKLSSVPFAAAAGNHDFYSPLYSRYYSETGKNGFGNDRYFMHGNALIIILDSNNISVTSHETTLRKAVEDFPDAKWRIVVMHHSPYSADSDEFSNKIAGKSLTPLFDEYEIDLVLSGHDHFYARTYAIKDEKIDTNGTVYLQAGSASGGKCGHFTTDSDEYIEFSQDLNEASYSLLTFSDNTLTIKSYVTGDDAPFDTFTLTPKTDRNDTPAWSISAKLIRMIVELFNKICNVFK